MTRYKYPAPFDLPDEGPSIDVSQWLPTIPIAFPIDIPEQSVAESTEPKYSLFRDLFGKSPAAAYDLLDQGCIPSSHAHIVLELGAGTKTFEDLSPEEWEILEHAAEKYYYGPEVRPENDQGLHVSKVRRDGGQEDQSLQSSEQSDMQGGPSPDDEVIDAFDFLKR